MTLACQVNKAHCLLRVSMDFRPFPERNHAMAKKLGPTLPSRSERQRLRTRVMLVPARAARDEKTVASG